MMEQEELTDVIETLETNLNNLQESYDILENNFEVYKEETMIEINSLRESVTTLNDKLRRELEYMHHRLIDNTPRSRSLHKQYAYTNDDMQQYIRDSYIK